MTKQMLFYSNTFNMKPNIERPDIMCKLVKVLTDSGSTAYWLPHHKTAHFARQKKQGSGLTSTHGANDDGVRGLGAHISCGMRCGNQD
jgi:hypothetical protein